MKSLISLYYLLPYRVASCRSSTFEHVERIKKLVKSVLMDDFNRSLSDM